MITKYWNHSLVYLQLQRTTRTGTLLLLIRTAADRLTANLALRSIHELFVHRPSLPSLRNGTPVFV